MKDGMDCICLCRSIQHGKIVQCEEFAMNCFTKSV